MVISSSTVPQCREGLTECFLPAITSPSSAYFITFTTVITWFKVSNKSKMLKISICLENGGRVYPQQAWRQHRPLMGGVWPTYMKADISVGQDAIKNNHNRLGKWTGIILTLYTQKTVWQKRTEGPWCTPTWTQYSNKPFMEWTVVVPWPPSGRVWEVIFPLFSTEPTTGVLCLLLGSPVQERQRYTISSLMYGQRSLTDCSAITLSRGWELRLFILEKAFWNSTNIHKYPKGGYEKDTVSFLSAAPLVPALGTSCITAVSSACQATLLCCAQALAQAAHTLRGLPFGAAHGAEPCSGWLCWGRSWTKKPLPVSSSVGLCDPMKQKWQLKTIDYKIMHVLFLFHLQLYLLKI